MRDVKRLLANGREAAPPDLLSRLEEAARGAHREARSRRSRRRALVPLAATLGVAAAVTLFLSLGSPAHPETSSIGPERLAEKKHEPSPSPATREPAVVATTPVPSARPLARTVKPRPPTLGEEVAWLAEARKALQNGDAKQALAVLDRRRADLRGGQLRLEAEVLRLEALSSLGATKEASDRARAFIEQNPNSPLVDRVSGYVND